MSEAAETEKPDVPLCKNCEHFLRYLEPNRALGMDLCLFNKNENFNLVRGHFKTENPKESLQERKDSGDCGVEGKNFEPRQFIPGFEFSKDFYNDEMGVPFDVESFESSKLSKLVIWTIIAIVIFYFIYQL